MSQQLDHSPALTELLLQREIENVVNIESVLLDDRRFEEWVELFSDDVRYWMPTRSVRYERDIDHELSRPDEVALFDESKDQLGERVVRIRSGMAWAEDPPSRTRHLFTNVMVEPAVGQDEYQVRTNFLVYQGRLQRDVDIFIGVRHDTYRRDADAEYGWLITDRQIILDQSVLLAKGLSIFF
jgi:3-phenylpropionate/cinnamic acid dioxygenase small subunit